MQCSRPAERNSKFCLVFFMETLYFRMNAKNISWILLFVKQRILCFYKFHEHFLRWQPGGDAAPGCRAARAVGRPETPRMGNRLGATSGALISMLFVLLFENSYSKLMKINAFSLFFHAPRGPTYGRPPGRCQRNCDLHVFWVLGSLLCGCDENLWKRLYFSSLRRSCSVLHAFP